MLGRFLKRQDAFGEPVTINYRGEATYNTMWGAFWTIVEKVFILVVAILGLIDLLAYKDPSVTQVSHFVLFFINQKQAKETSKGLQRKFFNRINFPPYAFTIYYRKKLVHRSVSKNKHCR